jgi:hypothetical protein
MYLKDIGCYDVNWIHLASEEVPVVGSCLHGNVLPGSIISGEFLDQCKDYQLVQNPVSWCSLILQQSYITELISVLLGSFNSMRLVIKQLNFVQVLQIERVYIKLIVAGTNRSYPF